jgi:hypothetical protein
MSWFSSNKYSQKQKYITKKQIKDFCTWVGDANISQADSKATFEAVLKKRGTDGQMSLSQVYDALTKLKNQSKISKSDRSDIIKRFEENWGK